MCLSPALHASLPLVTDPVFDAMGAITTSFQTLVQSNGPSHDTFKEVCSLVTLAQGLLRTLGVSHESIEVVDGISRRICGVPSKLTGAGGGGVAITILGVGGDGVGEGVGERLQRVMEQEGRWGEYKFTTTMCEAGGQGVLVHEGEAVEAPVLAAMEEEVGVRRKRAKIAGVAGVAVAIGFAAYLMGGRKAI